MLQNMNGFSEGQKNDRREQTKRMFDRTLKLLRKEGASFKNVVRTWIYLSDILEWYGDFNVERNAKFQEFGLLHNDSDEKSQAENIYLPASTGIFGYNPLGAANAMDVFAVIPQNENAMIIEPTSGLKQKSPYRYGSAFSRAMNVKESDVTYILLSGTAAIDDQGNSLYPGDTCAQIKKTFEIVEALISKEGASLDDICKATVFLKRSEDHSIYLKTVSELGLENLPAVCVVADVCRDDLLFELDAGVALVKS